MQFNNKLVIQDKQAILTLPDHSLQSYQDMIQARTLPRYTVSGNTITFPASYAIETEYETGKLPFELTDGLFDYQQVITKVAWFKERYAIFADAGLGKTYILGELARQIHTSSNGKILFCVPLNVMRQFEEMVQDFFPDFPPFIHLHKHKMTLREWCHYGDERIAFINHEAFIKPQDLKNVDAILLDEASILKGGQGGNGKIAKHLIDCTIGIRWKYVASATPAPNDRTEYSMIAQFLEITRTEQEFYSLFFTIKDDKYVLKRHATEAFYRYLASFSIFVRSPVAYGFEDNLAGLLPWQEIYKRVEMTQDQLDLIDRWSTKGKQMSLAGVATKPRGMTQRGKFSQISKGFAYLESDDNGRREIVSVQSRKPKVIADIVKSHLPEQVIIWVVFDEEGEIIKRELDKFNISVVHITGKVKEDKRIEYIEQFRHGELDVIISKPRILGFGLNFQFCRIAIYSGLQDSYELYYQSAKRIHRYGQDKQVLLYHIYTAYEEVILSNVLKKQTEMQRDFEYQEKLYIRSLYDELKQFLELEDYRPMETQTAVVEPIITDRYQLWHGDSIKILTDIATNDTFYHWLTKNSVDFSVFSPPFMGDVFTYTNDPSDMGNTRGAGAEGGLDEFMLQFQFFLRGMLAITKPGRLMAMHLEDVPLRKALDGHIGLFDFVGSAIREANEAGWILLAKIPILKNQQMTAIVKKVSSLGMGNMETDRLRVAPCQNGQLVLFRKPGEAKRRIADIAVCQSCDWQGYAKSLNNWAPSRGYKGAFALEPQARTKIKDGTITYLTDEDRAEKISDYIEYEQKRLAEQLMMEIDIEIDPSTINIDTPTSSIWMTCPQCESQDIIYYQEMDGNKWIMLAEGCWTDHPNFNPEDYDKIAKEAQSKRWHDLVYTSLGMWPDINEPDTLHNPFTSDQEDADKHLCPLPMEIARRAIELYTLPGETVLDPFAGIGTTLDAALRLNRKAIGIELKPEYFLQAYRNAEKAIQEKMQLTLFDLEAL